MAFMMDAQKDLRVDMGESFPYLGPYERTKASTVLPRWECSIDVPTVMARYGGVLTSPVTFNEGGLSDIRSGGDGWTAGEKYWIIVSASDDSTKKIISREDKILQ